MRYAEMSRDRLQAEYKSCLSEYERLKAQNLSLNMARGKPNTQQLDLANGMLCCLAPADCFAEDGTDVRNYGGLDGLPEMKRLFAEILDTTPEEILVGGNSSLNMMFDCFSTLMMPGSGSTFNLKDTSSAVRGWYAPAAEHSGHSAEPLKFICPAPGYDRHFAICEYFGLEMLTVPMTPDGPDMDVVEALAADPSVVGMWCVPVFSNPQGYVYSDATVRRLAKMSAHTRFRLFWDNAYTVHHFRGERPEIPNILRECESGGNPDRALVFTSFSKISFAGSAVACMAASKNNRDFFRKRLSIQTVGPDKMNQMRHVRYFKDLNGVLSHMRRQADILRPKFELADALLTERLGGTDAANWQCPNGGYFLSVDTAPGCAKRTVALCKEAGVSMTDAGATYPYRQDPSDCNIRVAPSYLDLNELEQALEVFCVSVKLAALETEACHA